MGDKATFPDRLKALNLNVDALDRVIVGDEESAFEIPNVDGKKGSLQIYAAITTNDSYIGPEQARRGLGIFGEELRQEAREHPGAHPSISLLEEIAQGDKARPSYVFRKNTLHPIPLSSDRIEEIAQEFGTPFHIYDEAGIRENAKNLYDAFSWAPNFKNFFAVKALPNPHILEILKQEGMGADCSSLPELMIADAVGLNGEEIMFTSNDTPANEFRKANDLGSVVNFDDITHIDYFQRNVGPLPELACCRFNPGELKRGNSIIGAPMEAKYGFTREQLSRGFRKLRDKGVERFGLHTMVASNELDADYFAETAKILFDTVSELHDELGINFEFVNLGGGIGIPYKPEQRAVDLKKVGEGIRDAYETILRNGLHPLKIYMENGRMVTGPNGWLVSRVLHVANKHKDYVGLDASMANLMRPALYGAYHHITVNGKENKPLTNVYDVTGSLCENNDKFAVNRMLPRVRERDLVIIGNTGAHGYAMGFNYNGKLKCQELLLRKDGSVKQIRRAETPQDYFATLNYKDL